MSGTLLILAPAGEDALPWPWVHVSGGNIVASGIGGEAPETDLCVLAVPGQDVRIFPHDLPKLRKSEQMSALAFAVEEHVATDMAEQHLAMGDADDKRVAIMAKSRMMHWQNTAQQQGFAPDHVVADFELLPDGTELALEDRTIQGGSFGHALDPGWTTTATNPQTLSDALSRMAEGLSSQYINLRQGEFVKKDNAKLPGRAWMGLAASLLLLGACWLGYRIVETRALNHRAVAIDAEAGRLYARATGKPAPVNPALAALRAQKQGGAGGATFFTLSTALFNAMQAVPGAEIQDMTFASGKGTLAFQMSFPDFADAQKLEDALATSGLRYTPGGVREAGDDRLVGEGVLAMEAGR